MEAALGQTRPPLRAGFTGFDAALYGAIIVVWGFSWIGIKYQLGAVPPIVSVAYRFGLATLVMFAWVAVSRRPVRFTLKAHALFAAMGVFMFSTNFVLFYYGGLYLVSGLLAVIFSTATVWNMLNAMIFLRQPAQPRVVAAALLGVGGLACVFWPEISRHGLGEGAVLGLALSLGGTLSFSIGNMFSARAQSLGLPVVSSTAYGMAYGTISLFAGAIITGQPFLFDAAPGYVISLIGLAVFSSVVAFASYLTLLGRIGPARAAYVTVLFPLVALFVSAVMENYHWSPVAIAGFAMVLAGNLMIMRR